MDRQTAIEIAAMMLGLRAHMQAIADHIRETVPRDERREYLHRIGSAMGSTSEISLSIYKDYPDLDPYGLPKPPPLAES